MILLLEILESQTSIVTIVPMIDILERFLGMVWSSGMQCVLNVHKMLGLVPVSREERGREKEREERKKERKRRKERRREEERREGGKKEEGREWGEKEREIERERERAYLIFA
jgi:hypothetical protein